MQLYNYAFAAMFGLVVTACDQGPQPRAPAPGPGASSGSSTSGSSTSTTPANIGQPASQAERKEGANPQQGQVDPKQPEQHKDFQQRGDERGPTSPDTQPKPGG